MERSRLSGTLVLLALVAVACNGSTAAEVDPSPSPTAAAAAPNPSPSPAPSPSPTEVLPANDVDDPVAALEAIVAYRDYLFENPDPDKLKLIYAERCSCYEEVSDLLDSFVAQQRRAVFDRGRAFTELRVEKHEGPLAEVTYTVDSPAGRIVEVDGTVVEDFGERPPAQAEAVLVKEGGRWRVLALILR